MVDLNKKYIDDIKFWEFVNEEFDSVASNSTLEELTEFAFGSVEEAIKAFESKNQIENETEFKKENIL
ncbi:MAG: hypothetical protein CVT88_05100 [Candidatus Altiarchaeales archaeon HGW-Altiarchaeales-1]|nr:MAG: hypothetical protein CVT88_05100 [Candidatus Altiarchaeales archaeon HGW-Altiarchaeales-1]